MTVEVKNTNINYQKITGKEDMFPEETKRLSTVNLQEFLAERRTTNDPYHTHVSMGIPRGSYTLGSRHFKRFYELYADTIENNTSRMCLAEAPEIESPILVDVDLRVKKSDVPHDLRGKKLYSQEQLEKVIWAYQEAIDQTVDKTKEDMYTCVVLEKEPYEAEIAGEVYIKNGFHLQFPKIFMERKCQTVYIIPIVKSKLKGLFDNINVENFIDENVMNVHWLVYGSRKEVSKEPYIATQVFERHCVKSTFEESLGDYECGVFFGEEPFSVKGNVMRFMPRILSIAVHGRNQYFYDPKPTVLTPIIKEWEKLKHKRKEYDQLNIDIDMEEARKYVYMMNISRADDRSIWLQVGFCLWQLSQGDDEGLTLWIEFSELSDKFNETEILYQWGRMRPSNYTIGTLKFYAKQDNPEAYAEHVTEKSKSFILSGGCHTDFAKALYNEYGNEFVCSSITNKEWYQFKDHIWRPVDKGQTLRQRISSQEGVLITLLEERIETLKNERKRPENETVGIKDLRKLITKCKNTSFKNNVMIECQEVFYKENFSELINKNPNLVAFTNGVYDFTNDVFRDGTPEDYLSICMPIEYIDYRSVSHPKVTMVDEFFQKIFPDPQVRDYFLDEACRVFVGGNYNKVALFWTGTGDNGKTITQTLFEKMLGKLAIKFSTTLVTGKKTPVGGPNPEMTRASNGVRWAVMDEPNADEVINSGILKWLTGNDTFWARDLFQKGKDTKEITPMFKLHMICNNLPSILGADKATWNRIRVIPFESTFVPEHECPETFEEQIKQKIFPMDPHFTDKIPKMVEPLAWYLIQRWKTINKLTYCSVPDKVRARTDIYRRNNDVYQQFIQQCVFDRSSGQLQFSTLYTYFKDWYKDEVPNTAVPTKSVVRQYFATLWGEPTTGKYWTGKSVTPVLFEDEEPVYQTQKPVLDKQVVGIPDNLVKPDVNPFEQNRVVITEKVNIHHDEQLHEDIEDSKDDSEDDVDKSKSSPESSDDDDSSVSGPTLGSKRNKGPSCVGKPVGKPKIPLKQPEHNKTLHEKITVKSLKADVLKVCNMYNITTVHSNGRAKTKAELCQELKKFTSG